MDSNGRTPLHAASESGHASNIRALIKLGAKIDVVDPNKNTPLHLAIIAEKKDTADELCKQGANMDARNADERNPLHLAGQAQTRRMALINLLIDRGADINWRTGLGETVAHMIAEDDNLKPVVLIRHMEELADLGVDFYFRNRKGLGALQIAQEHIESFGEEWERKKIAEIRKKRGRASKK